MAGTGQAGPEEPGQRPAAPAVPGPDLPGPEQPGSGNAGRDAAAGTGHAQGPGAGQDQVPAAPGEELAAMAFARLTVLPAVLVIAWLLPALPLLVGGVFNPVPALLISVPLAVVLAATGLHWLPARWPRRMPGPARDRTWSAWWALGGTAAVAAGFIAWQLLANSPSVIVTRAPGAYLQAGYWIAQHGSLPIPQSLAAFGGAHHGLRFSSTGFFASGGSVVPGFSSGLPLVLAGAFWTHGISAAAGLSPVLGGLAIVAFGGLVARLAGMRWAPAGALILALALPEQYTSRSALTEPLAQILLFGGLCLVIDALMAPAAAAAGWRRLTRPGWSDAVAPQRLLALLGGLALGLTVLVNVGSLAPLLAVIPFAGILAVRRRPAAVPFCAGIVVGVGYGLADGYLLARPFMSSIRTQMELAGVAAAWLAALTMVVIQLLRNPGACAVLRRALAARPLRWLPEAAGVLTAAGLIALAVRPYLQTVRGQSSRGALGYVAVLQRAQHLPVDPGRLYAEDSLYWVIWYIGGPAVLLGGFGFALLVRRCLRALLAWRGPAEAERSWGLPLAMIGIGSATVLWMPDIVPDQPWASRRLLLAVIPGLILCAMWAGGWLVGLARARGAGRVTATVVGVFCVVAVALPAVATNFGLDLSHSGRAGGLRPAEDGLALHRTGAGEIAAVRALCASIPPHASVLILDHRVAAQLTQVIRGSCGVPVGWLAGPREASAGSVISGVMRAGRRPVLLAARRSELTVLSGAAAVQVMNLRTTQDPHSLAQPPPGPEPARYVVWMATLGSAAAGA